MNTENLKKDIANFMARLYQRGLTTCSGGNISCRLPDNTILITPGGKDKGNLCPEDIGHCDYNGENLVPQIKLSMETSLHLSIYKIRPDIFAIVHAHPPFASAFAACHKTIPTHLLGESRALLGEVSLANYYLMGSPELALTTAHAFSKSNAVVMANHGVITTGKTLFTAYDRMEVLETTAKNAFICQLIGGEISIPATELAKIDNLFENI